MKTIKSLIRNKISLLTFPRKGTVFKDQLGDYWYSDDNAKVAYGQYGVYYSMKQNSWGVWKTDRHCWVKKNGSPFTGIILKRIDKDETVSV